MEHQPIARKHLIWIPITGLAVGAIAGAPLGWMANGYYSEQRLAQILICREKNRDRPVAIVEARCGSRF
ncbi:hypothetical protein Osc7112_3818 [Oscillatoria nigro-viridis PCC 7112]|uniref:Uncharacterized protein n=1 Tax=Phormidium nigroviride PCC 7112 TaxID=179408 RepID=K9VLR3_9CYAN|nr:hypothetical protein [Oscillatoria nigro-viridis]AFZ08160.1 hypothetical protein Osc7112_3818 [Oscillatoria nigro-viridis PCC 7112]